MGKRTLILGMGSSLRGDDGVGLYVARALKKSLVHPSIDIMETEESGFKFLDLLMDYQRLIIIDSIDKDNIKSPILGLTRDDLPTKSWHILSHQMGIFELIKIGKQLGLSMPTCVIIYAIPIRKQNRFNLTLSKKLKRKIPKLTRLILALCKMNDTGRDFPEKKHSFSRR